MLFRFCLYGFLKNQQYFDPFLVLVFLHKGLSFLQFGLLVAVREVTINLFEVLSGAVADVYGRRRAMIGSFIAYIASFMTLGLAHDLASLFLGMFLFGIGDAFRTGTHKAIIFSWLRAQGRENERARVYGSTRSWSKIGSAVSSVLAAVFVLLTDSYEVIFFAAVVPYALGIVNFLGYPAELGAAPAGGAPAGAVVRHMAATVRTMWRSRRLRRLVLESMGFEGMFKAAKDYLQPLLQTAAILWWTYMLGPASLGERQQTACLVGPVYFGVYLLSAAASRQAHRLLDLAGSEDRAARWLWAAGVLLFAGLLPALWFDLRGVAIAMFVCLFVLQNAWRPILISRFDAQADESQGATVLSVENQAKSLATMLLAPLLGALVDLARHEGLGGADGLWPVAAVGVALAMVFALTAGRQTGD